MEEGEVILFSHSCILEPGDNFKLIILPQESCYPYWPTNQGLTTKYRGIGVTLKSEEKYHAYIVRKFEVFEGKSKSTAVRKKIVQHYNVIASSGQC